MSPLTRIFPQTTVDKRQKKLIITQSRDTGNIGQKTQNKTSKTNKHNTETEKQLQNGRHKKTKTKNKNKTKQKTKQTNKQKQTTGVHSGGYKW